VLLAKQTIDFDDVVDDGGDDLNFECVLFSSFTR
jgi:hypothetical protein